MSKREPNSEQVMSTEQERVTDSRKVKRIQQILRETNRGQLNLREVNRDKEIPESLETLENVGEVRRESRGVNTG
jgi:hypothetical protein